MLGSKVHFSVIIPARNEESYITDAIQSVRSQDYPGPTEIIVVNNASVDKTTRVAEKLAVQVVDEPRVGLPQARETGRQAAKGDILVYMDADTRLPTNYLSSLETAFRKHPEVVAVSNPFDFYDGSPLHKFVIGLFFGIIYPLQNFLLLLIGKSHQVLGGSFAVRASTMEKMGGFNTNITFYGEDLALSKGLAHYGKIKILPTIYTHTSARRFQAYGTLRTSLFYVKNFFTVLFFNRDSDGTFFKQLLKFGFLIVILTAAFRYLHIGHLLFAHKDENMERLGGLLILLFLYGMFYPRSKLFGPSLSRFNTSEPIIALTFDDGPNAKSTPKVLDILKKEDVKATFFLVGKNAEKNPEIVARIMDEGHEIGNHTNSHKWLFPFLSPGYISSEVDQAQRKIKMAGGLNSSAKKIFRPPHGWRTPWMFNELRRKNYDIIMWDISIDFLPGVSAKAVKNRILRKTKPGSILLFHDAIWERPEDERTNLVESLPEIIKELKNQDYKLVRVGDML